MKDDLAKFELIFELSELGERAFVHKLKQKNPQITPTEIAEAVKQWYQDRPGAEFGDGVGVPGDIRRFDPCQPSQE